MSWVTSRIVRPASRIWLKTSKHFCWKAASPTASTSSISRIVGVDLDRDREREPHVHARRVVLELEVLELLELGELDHLVVARARASRGVRPSMIAVEDHVVARGEVGVEADAELDERRHAPVDVDLARVEPVDAGQALEQRALARAVAADDAEELARARPRRRRRAAPRARSVLRLRSGCSTRSLSVWVASWGRRNALRASATATAGGVPPMVTGGWCGSSR